MAATAPTPAERRTAAPTSSSRPSATFAAATRRLPEALLDPGAFPHLPDTVELRETHISWVFLAGDKAYKVKKPVRFPFVDYGTLARRRALCHAEVDLNVRFAPALYRGVVALVPRGIDRLRVAPEHDSQAVEYAVVMSRYDEASTLSAKLRRDAVSAADATAVGRSVAELHALAPAARAGGAQNLAAVVEETLSTLAGAGTAQRRLAELARFCRAALAGFDPELSERAARGRVRDGHGDLRADQVLVGDRIQAVDAIEFDPELRIADVGYDLALLAMDVACADDDLARAIVHSYRAAGGDPGSDALLAFFCALRALVRAKVDLLRAAQLDGAAAQERMARGLALLDVADRFAWRARLPRLVCVAGFAASGKSTVAEALATVSGRPLISSDRIRKLRAGIDPYERAAPSAYADFESRAIYAELAQRAALDLRDGTGVIVDATFRRKADADAFTAALPPTASAAWLVCEAPPAVLLERARDRAGSGSISDAGPNIVATELAVHRGRIVPPTPPLAHLDTTRPLPELLADLARALDERIAGGVA
jgi:aminoglycoside phosphotransferase family enzyme/predicted kinase